MFSIVTVTRRSLPVYLSSKILGAMSFLNCEECTQRPKLANEILRFSTSGFEKENPYTIYTFLAYFLQGAASLIN